MYSECLALIKRELRKSGIRADSCVLYEESNPSTVVLTFVISTHPRGAPAFWVMRDYIDTCVGKGYLESLTVSEVSWERREEDEYLLVFRATGKRC